MFFASLTLVTIAATQMKKVIKLKTYFFQEKVFAHIKDCKDNSVCAYLCVCEVLAHWVGQVLSVRELCRCV